MGWLCVPCWDFSLLEAAIFPCWDCSVLEADWRLAGLAEFVMFEFGCMRFSVEALMDLLVRTLVQEVDDLMEKGVRLRAIGDLSSLPEQAQQQLRESERRTAHLTGLDLVLALSYSAKWELVEAIRSIVESGEDPAAIDTHTVDRYLTTAGLPDPELMIRTSGERRISNFMLWQLAYAEFHFTSVMWPDFRESHFLAAIRDYQNRERRFGGVLDTNHNERNHTE